MTVSDRITISCIQETINQLKMTVFLVENTLFSGKTAFKSSKNDNTKNCYFAFFYEL